MHSDTYVLTLPARANLNDADKLAEQIMGALRSQRPVRVMTDAVTEMDIALLQILIAAHRQAQRVGQRLEVIVPPGGAVLSALEQFGVINSCDVRLELSGEVWSGVRDA